MKQPRFCFQRFVRRTSPPPTAPELGWHRAGLEPGQASEGQHRILGKAPGGPADVIEMHTGVPVRPAVLAQHPNPSEENPNSHDFLSDLLPFRLPPKLVKLLSHEAR